MWWTAAERQWANGSIGGGRFVLCCVIGSNQSIVEPDAAATLLCSSVLSIFHRPLDAILSAALVSVQQQLMPLVELSGCHSAR
jgi:hypothetical protein